MPVVAASPVRFLAIALALAACAPVPAAREAVAADTSAVMDVADDALALTATWPVGVTAADWTDPTRATPANGDVAGHPGRHLPSQIWYPAAGAAGGAVTDNAPSAAGVFPLLLFVHGFSGTPSVYSGICQRLAALGYVVVAADFPLTSLLTDGGPSDWHAEMEQGDLAFLADQALGANVPAPLTGHLDVAAGYAVVGHSTGGTVALLAAYRPDGHDSRVRAVVDLSGDSCFFDAAFFATRAVPLLAVGATRDLLVPAANNPARAFALASAPAVLVTLRGGTHLHTTDLTIADPTDSTPTGLDDPLAQTMAAWGKAAACRPIPPPGAEPLLDNDTQRDLIALSTRAFLDAYVKGAPTGLQQLLAKPDARLEIQAK